MAKRLIDAMTLVTKISKRAMPLLSGRSPQDVYNAILECIAEAPTVDMVCKSWVPVTEQLPEKGVRVLCIGKRGAMFIGEPSHSISVSNGSVYCYVPNARAGREATHWMPLPEPPKEVT